jgi:hypothetical protein
VDGCGKSGAGEKYEERRVTDHFAGVVDGSGGTGEVLVRQSAYALGDGSMGSPQADTLDERFGSAAGNVALADVLAHVVNAGSASRTRYFFSSRGSGLADVLGV